MAVVPLPATYRLARWLDREALRIRAGVKNATIENAANSTYRAARSRGCDDAAATADAEQVIAYLQARIAQLDDLLSSPLPYDIGRVHNG
ncbi:hypothetical protein [Ciceribacter azotifigens]|uniref:hypothetical protein n=1 Tax=Ciceribacter azotifigens TaxID=2069303 RepID=UPI003A887EE0